MTAVAITHRKAAAVHELSASGPTALVDLTRLADAVHVLCTPLAYHDIPAWRAAALQAVARVIGAERAGTLLVAAEAQEPITTGGDPLRALGTMLAGPDFPSTMPPAALSALLAAGRAGFALLRQAGVPQSALVRQLESTATPALVFDMEGRELHRTAAVTPLLGAQDGELLLTMERLVRRLADVDQRRSMVTRPPRDPTLPERRRRPRNERDPLYFGQISAQAGARCFLLTPTMHPNLAADGRAAVVIVVQATTCLESDDALRERHGLTGREVEVARALTSGASVADIAARLKVSVHTVRRHSEQVYRKLGVNTRREVAQRLAEWPVA